MPLLTYFIDIEPTVLKCYWWTREQWEIMTVCYNIATSVTCILFRKFIAAIVLRREQYGSDSMSNFCSDIVIIISSRSCRVKVWTRISPGGPLMFECVTALKIHIRLLNASIMKLLEQHTGPADNKTIAHLRVYAHL